MFHHRTLFFVVLVVGLAIGQENGRAQTVRKLAAGVLTVIPPEPHEQETFQGPIPLANVSKLDWTPNFTPKTDTLRDKSAQVILRHNVWNLELAFKPVRMVHVDIPQTIGKMQRKLIWYMVYRVRNLGGHLTPVPAEDKTYTTGTRRRSVERRCRSSRATRFAFSRISCWRARRLARSIWIGLSRPRCREIQLREMRGAKLLNSVEITQVAIPVVPRDGGPGVWGVVTWEDVDPRIDFFSIYVQGLTNAFRLEPCARREAWRSG